MNLFCTGRQVIVYSFLVRVWLIFDDHLYWHQGWVFYWEEERMRIYKNSFENTFEKCYPMKSTHFIVAHKKCYPINSLKLNQIADQNSVCTQIQVASNFNQVQSIFNSNSFYYSPLLYNISGNTFLKDEQWQEKKT